MAGLAIVDYEDLTLEEIITSPEAKEQWMAGLQGGGRLRRRRRGRHQLGVRQGLTRRPALARPDSQERP